MHRASHVDNWAAQAENRGYPGISTERLKKITAHTPVMKSTTIARLVIIVVLFASLICLQACRSNPPPDLSNVQTELCTRFIMVDNNGRRWLNTSRITMEDADMINSCLRAAGITNVRIVQNLSDAMSATYAGGAPEHAALAGPSPQTV